MCDCGKEKTVRSDCLKNGTTKSCGCLNYENRPSKHGKSSTKLYHVWASMKNRCNNMNDTNYHHYGGRGITYSPEWEKFEPYYEWSINNGYREGLSIDRIDVNGNYEPSNCRWVTMSFQQNNKRDNVLITYEGETNNIKQWSDILGVSYNLLHGRLYKYGMDLVKVINSLK